MPEQTGSAVAADNTADSEAAAAGYFLKATVAFGLGVHRARTLHRASWDVTTWYSRTSALVFRVDSHPLCQGLPCVQICLSCPLILTECLGDFAKVDP